MTPYTYAYDKRVLDSESLNTGGFKGVKGAMPPPKMPEVTRSPCQPKILVCSSAVVGLHKMCSLKWFVAYSPKCKRLYLITLCK